MNIVGLWPDNSLKPNSLDVGCGTGALSAAVMDRCAPSSLIGVEPSEGFRKLAAQNLGSQPRILAGVEKTSLEVTAEFADFTTIGNECPSSKT